MNKSFEEIILEKLDNNVWLTEEELKEVVFGFGIETEYGENRRWSRTCFTIVRLCERYFSVVWEQGLTEMQENEFYNQPVEVVKHTYEKTITVTKWIERREVDDEADCD